MNSSPLNCLPVELRAQIYDHLFQYGQMRLCDRQYYNQLLCTCRQIRLEASPIFYASNVFTYDFEVGHQTVRQTLFNLIGQLRALGPSALSSIKALVIEWYPLRVDWYKTEVSMERMTIQRADMMSFLPSPDETSRPVRLFKPGYVESEVVDAYRLMGVKLRADKGVRSWVLDPAPPVQTLRPLMQTKMDFWGEVWDHEMKIMTNPDHWQRPDVRTGLFMLCRCPSLAEELDQAEAMDEEKRMEQLSLNDK